MNNIYLDKINYYNKQNNIYKLNKYVYKYNNLYGGDNNPLSIIGNKINLQSKSITNLTDQSTNIINQSKNIISNVTNQSKNIIEYINNKLGNEWTILGTRGLTLFLLMKNTDHTEKKFNISKCIKFFLMIDYNDFFNNYFLYENLLGVKIKKKYFFFIFYAGVRIIISLSLL